MNALFSILFSTTIASILFYGIYWICTSREKYFTVNRFYLLGSLLFSFVLPFIHIDLSLFSSETNSTLLSANFITLPELTITPDSTAFMSVGSFLLLLYLIGVVIFTIKFIVKISTLLLLIRHSTMTKTGKIKIIDIKENYTPFSFFNNIFINRDNYSRDSYEKIILHEKEHIRQGHSFDLMIVEIARILQWYNPIIMLYSHSLRSLHEYSADDRVIKHGIERNDYFELLFNTISGKQLNNISNNFNYLLTKKRITMMTQLKKSKWVTVKLLLALPLVAALLFANGTQAQTSTPKSAKAEKVTEVKEAQKAITSQPTQKIAPEPTMDVKKDVNQAEEKAIDRPEVEPEFPGGMEALYAYLAKNLKYSDEAKKNEVQGNVLISFIIEKNGKISNAKITANGLKGKENTPESVINDCALQALKIIKEMPDWKPGMNKGKPVKTNFAIPIRFALH